ncbi:hypothetical protein LG634_36310 [Streptomyces bambusae]|uniref:hypothetical protein n=1 Tax=Streptomyces bambusae TaxID=1550616 RepID=UPI001CFF97BA|nr:hypothetical protein [Streptomyces bambusae]MCB5170250.1 hypothetical protein [Streptomyces bambusae]
MSDAEAEGWPCLLSEEVSRILVDPLLDGRVFSAVVALTVAINETRGEVPGHTASDKWPELRRIPVGRDGSLGLAEYVVAARAEEPHCVLTRIQLL